METIDYPEIEFNDYGITISKASAERIVNIIEESHLLRSLMILNNMASHIVYRELVKIINSFLDYIAEKEKSKKIVDPVVIDKYDYFIHMENFKSLYYILSYIPNPKKIKIENAKNNNIFYYYFNTSGYYKKHIAKESRKNEVIIKNMVSDLYKEFLSYYDEFGDKSDMDTVCKTFFESKMSKKKKKSK